MWVTSTGGIYISGKTDSDDFPTANAYQPDRSGQVDGFLALIGEPYSPPPQEITVAIDLAAGTTAADYRILSMPVVASPNTPAEVIGSRSGRTIPTRCASAPGTKKTRPMTSIRSPTRSNPAMPPGSCSGRKAPVLHRRTGHHDHGPMEQYGYSHAITQAGTRSAIHTISRECQRIHRRDGNGDYQTLTDTANAITRTFSGSIATGGTRPPPPSTSAKADGSKN